MTVQQYCTDLNPLCSPIGIFCAGCAAHSKQIGSRHYLASLVVSIPISSSSSSLLYSRPYRMYVKSEEKCNEYGRTRSKKKKKSHKENAVHQCNFACVYWSVRIRNTQQDQCTQSSSSNSSFDGGYNPLAYISYVLNLPDIHADEYNTITTNVYSTYIFMNSCSNVHIML